MSILRALDALFRVIARRYDLLILDLPPLWFEWTPQVLSVCDLAIVTGLNIGRGPSARSPIPWKPCAASRVRRSKWLSA